MKIKKNMIVLMFVAILAITIHPNVSKAALQANGSEPIKSTIGSWLLNIRKMEATRRNIRFR